MARPTHIIVVDEAGGPPIRVGGVPNGYVTCAVAIPIELRARVVALLPRDPDSGKPLKAVSQNTTDQGLAAFLESFFALGVAAGLLSVDSTDHENVETLQEAVDLANASRQGKDRFNPMTTAYGLFAPKAVIQAWSAVSLRQGLHLRNFSLTLDEANLHSRLRNKLVAAIQESFKDQDVHVDEVRWGSEQEEPLLCVPDYIAGITLRKFTRNDCPASFSQLQHALDRKQLLTQDPVEIYSLPPQPRGE